MSVIGTRTALLSVAIKTYFHNLYLALATGRRALANLRAEWGHEVHRDRNSQDISLYHRLQAATKPERFVDDDTWQDLDLETLFSRVDRSVSYTGSQYLYHLMHTYAAEDVLTGRFDQYEYFTQQADSREQILLQLRRLRHGGARFIPHLVFQAVPQRPRAYYLIYLASCLTVLSSVLIIVQPLFALATVVLIIGNLFIGRYYGRRCAGYYADISSLSTLLKVGISLAGIDDSNIPQVRELRRLRDFSVALNRKLGWLTIDESRLDDFSQIVVSYFNYFCLFNLVSFVRAVGLIGSQQAKIGLVYELIGSLDAVISIASYLAGTSGYCQPQFKGTGLIDVSDIYHPLLTDPVANSFQAHQISSLITGSNMAGKTTFMKTIGLNIILGQTLGVCLAKEASLPRSIVKSSIRRSDDLNDNKSYYFKEIEAILEFMTLADQTAGYVFLIDEIFRGTNTIERIASAVSVLKYLSRRSMCLVTTHDVELQKLLADDFRMFHFSEQIAAGRHYFDYRIQDGPTSSHNAIRLLELKGYPTSVVMEAYDLAARLADSDHSAQT